jgi:hypothetical protein
MEPALQITDEEFIAKHDSFVEGAAEQSEPEDVYEPEDDGFCYAPGLLKRIKAAQQQYREGKGTICRTHEELMAHLNSL